MFDPTRGPAREVLDKKQLSPLIASGAVITDDRRLRSLYFDGRFLNAQALVRDQNYFLTRQADLMQAAGFGVVQGLMVTPADLNVASAASYSITLAQGHGITPNGGLVSLPEDQTINVADLAQIEKLDAAFGLRSTPQESSRNLSGLFVVGLRPVEYTANPVPAYPTSLNGARTSDGTIVEATAITLIPYADINAVTDFQKRRSRVEREIFVEGATQRLPNDVLPLAMIALNRQVVEWVDPFLVRREIGTESHPILSLGIAPQGLRDAHILQYRQRLQEILAQNRPGNFPVTKYFSVLPPVGEIPYEAVNTDNWTQSYFPSDIDVELSLIPEDEIAALVAEGLTLPLIDLQLNANALKSTSVLILIPVSRSKFRDLQTQLSSPVNTAGANALPEGTSDPDWRSALKQQPTLWYTRRRNLAYRSEPVGVPVDIQ